MKDKLTAAMKRPNNPLKGMDADDILTVISIGAASIAQGNEEHRRETALASLAFAIAMVLELEEGNNDAPAS